MEDGRPEFQPWPKIARYNRDCVVTEKIDGTNACIVVDEYGDVHAQSRTRFITPEDDNYGFARWVQENEDELFGLGAGRHYGEWWGQGIQRKYGMDHKRFSLFNTGRWRNADTLDGCGADLPPACCHVVPVLWRGLFALFDVDYNVRHLRKNGSVAAPGFMKPEGLVVWHETARVSFKVTLEKDTKPKGANRG